MFKVVKEDGEELEMKVQAYSPLNLEDFRVGKRTQVLIQSEDFIGNENDRKNEFKNKYCSARVLVDPSITHLLERQMNFMLRDSLKPKKKIMNKEFQLSFLKAGGSGLKELVLELSPVNVVCVNAGMIYAESVRYFNGRVDSALKAKISKAIVARPAILLFEDLHNLLPAEAPEGEVH